MMTADQIHSDALSMAMTCRRIAHEYAAWSREGGRMAEHYASEASRVRRGALAHLRMARWMIAGARRDEARRMAA
jgi:hypothetical protein